MVGLEAVEDDAEFAEGRDDLDDPGDLLAAQRIGQAEHAEIEQQIGLVAEFDGEIAVAERPEFRCVVDHSADPRVCDAAWSNTLNE